MQILPRSPQLLLSKEARFPYTVSFGSKLVAEKNDLLVSVRMEPTSRPFFPQILCSVVKSQDSIRTVILSCLQESFPSPKQSLTPPNLLRQPAQPTISTQATPYIIVPSIFSPIPLPFSIRLPLPPLHQADPFFLSL